MNGYVAFVAALFILAGSGLIFFALGTDKEVWTELRLKLLGLLKIHIKPRDGVAQKNHPAPPKKRTDKLQDHRPALPRHWRALLILSFVLTLMIASLGWWFERPAPLRMLISYEFNEMLNLLRHGPLKPLEINRGQGTLDRLTRLVKMHTDQLKDRYHNEEIWIVDHYWRYWLTSGFHDYLRANQDFVAEGGKIHRMFVLAKRDINDPKLEIMLNAQCEIGKATADQTGNGFELWLADLGKMKGQKEYPIISDQFQHLLKTDKPFANFDVVQFSDALYSSDDFGDRDGEQFLGRSTWILDRGQFSQIDLRRLFSESIAVDRFNCSNFQNSVRQVRERATPSDSKIL